MNMTRRALDTSVQAGQRLLAVRDVAVPLWRLPLLCRLLERRSVSMLQEFHLRAIDAGINSRSEIARLLTLPEPVVRLTLTEMHTSGTIHPMPNSSGSGTAYMLAPAGRELLRTWAHEVAVEKVVQFRIDAVTLRPTHQPKELLRTAREAELQNLLMMPATSESPPDFGQEDTNGFRRVYSQARGANAPALVSVIGVEGKYETQYLAATASLYESTDDGELSVRLSVDGRSSEVHDTAVLEHDLIRRMKVKSHVDQSRRRVDNLLGENAVNQRASDLEVASLLVQAQRLTATDTSLSVKDEEQDPQVQRTEERLNSIGARRLAVSEQSSLWPGLFELARTSLVVVSDFLDGEFWENVLRPYVVASLDRGVGVTLVYRHARFWIDGHQEREPRVALSALLEQYAALSIQQLDRGGANSVVIDNELVVVSSAALLAAPERASNFADDRGTLIRGAQLLAEVLPRVKEIR